MRPPERPETGTDTANSFGPRCIVSILHGENVNILDIIYPTYTLQGREALKTCRSSESFSIVERERG
jgi:hypothetical protein